MLLGHPVKKRLSLSSFDFLEGDIRAETMWTLLYLSQLDRQS